VDPAISCLELSWPLTSTSSECYALVCNYKIDSGRIERSRPFLVLLRYCDLCHRKIVPLTTPSSIASISLTVPSSRQQGARWTNSRLSSWRSHQVTASNNSTEPQRCTTGPPKSTFRHWKSSRRTSRLTYPAMPRNCFRYAASQLARQLAHMLTND
jgi:hypothetical protein